MLSTKHNLSGCNIYCWKCQSENVSGCGCSYPSDWIYSCACDDRVIPCLKIILLLYSYHPRFDGGLKYCGNGAASVKMNSPRVVPLHLTVSVFNETSKLGSQCFDTFITWQSKCDRLIRLYVTHLVHLRHIFFRCSSAFYGYCQWMADLLCALHLKLCLFLQCYTENLCLNVVWKCNKSLLFHVWQLKGHDHYPRHCL